MRTTRNAPAAVVAHPLGSMDRYGADGVAFDPAQLMSLEHWIVEREAIRRRKERGEDKPWTSDPVLQANRFCNVRRMDDKVSIWLLNHWYGSMANAGPRVLLTMATLARHINWPDTLEELLPTTRGGKQAWRRDLVRDRLDHRAARGDKVFTGAYIINGARGGSKISQVVNTVDEVWQRAETWPTLATRKEAFSSMQLMHSKFAEVPGIGSFMAGQIVADLRHTHVLAGATDAMLWAPRGPGSTRGMNRLLLRQPLHSSYPDAAWQRTLCALWRVMYARKAVRAVFDSRKCELMDLQNCLCEFDKYMRVLTGEGRARNRYPGT